MRVITISREFGSGGREIAKRLADALHIAYYDREIITAIAKEAKLNESYVEKALDLGSVHSYPLTFSRTFTQLPAVDIHAAKLLAIQHKIIKSLAEKSDDCVIVGRGANTILQAYHPFRIFVYADMASKLTRCKNRAAADEQLSDQDIIRKIKQIDKARAETQDLISSARWGEKSGYDICINTTNIQIKEITPLIASYAKLWFQENKK